MNRTILVGRLTEDPEFRTTPNGVSVTTFTIAVNRTFTNAQGKREADFIKCVTFRKQADNVNKFLSKGSLAGVEGRIQTRSYENNEGRRIFVTEVVADNVQFLDTKKKSDENNNQQQQSNPFGNGMQNANGPIDISDDDLPF
ncbi:single-stranded DNA-binding protein [Staphylococcus caprae]|uniref:single-stranded DNA-binding protein n=1 Tax=Staphylococcus caprae TaxID=29380 RepID=UPI003B224056